MTTAASPLDDFDSADPVASGAQRRFRPLWSTVALVVGVCLGAASLGARPATHDRIVPLASGGPDEQGIATGPGITDAAPGPGAADPGATGSQTGGGGSTNRGAAAGKVTSGATQSSANLACAAGRNGGSTDVGVSATSIKLGATVAQSGIGASFLADVRFAMQAVTDKANRAGGICGRRISLKLVDDGWDFARGGEYLRNLVESDNVFALAVVPSSEGLKNVSDAHYLKDHGVPVIGSDGMLIGQYSDSNIWPVAASTVSTMHIMAKQAWDAGARDFGLVYDTTYHFGLEGAYAFNAAFKRLSGHDIDGYSDPFDHARCSQKFCGISADQESYGTEIQDFNNACGSCGFVGLLLEPATATKWMKGGGLRPFPPTRRMGGPQPLFTSDFANACGQACDQLWLWTGYTPPLGDFLGRPAVGTYVNDIKAASSTADYNNSFVEGGYIGMMLTVKALQDTGPNLTRQRLMATLDNTTFDTGGLAPALKWSAGNHFANVHMQAFSIQYKSGFTGWRDEQTGYDDPWIGQDGVRK